MYPGVHAGTGPAPRATPSPLLRRLHLEVQSLLWPSPPKWPSRPRPIPSSADIARAEKLVHERFLHDGEDRRGRAGAGLRPPPRARRGAGGARASRPSTRARRGGASSRCCSGLERVLSEEEPRLRDGTLLSAHQVDALSGTLTALLAEAERSAGNGNGNGRAAAAASPELLASASILGPDGDTRARERSGANGVAAERAAERARRDEDALARPSRTTSRTSRTRTTKTTRTTTGPGWRPRRRGRGRGRRGPGRHRGRARAAPERGRGGRRDRGRERGRAAGLGGRRGRGGGAPGSARGPQRGEALLVRARDRCRQDGGGARLRGGLADGGRPDPDAPAQPGRPVPRRAAPARLLQAHQPPAVRRGGLDEGAGDGRDLSVVRAQRGPHLERVHDRDLRRGAHRARREDQRRDPRSGRARSSSA